MTHSTTPLAAAALAALPAMAAAQPMSIGEREYVNNCAQCHGPAGKGNGFLVEYFLEQGAPDLTAPQNAKGGVFPVAELFALIEYISTLQED